MGKNKSIVLIFPLRALGLNFEIIITAATGMNIIYIIIRMRPFSTPNLKRRGKMTAINVNPAKSCPRRQGVFHYGHIGKTMLRKLI